MTERVLALSSVPPRFDALPEVLTSLLAQGADRVVLALPDHCRRFPGEWDLPELPQDVALIRGPDWGPGSKLLLPRAAFPQADLIICDDDCLYAPGWADALWDGPGLRAASVFDVTRLKRRGGPVAQGFAGIRVPPDVPVATEIPDAVRYADDLWFSAYWDAHGVDVVEVPAARALVTPMERAGALQEGNRAATYAAAAQFIHETLGVWPPI